MTRGGACPALGAALGRASAASGGFAASFLRRSSGPHARSAAFLQSRCRPSGDAEERRGWARAASGMRGRVGGAVEPLGRNIPSILRMTKGMDPNISCRFCIKPREEGQHQPKSRSPLKVPGHSLQDKRFLLWAGHFKKPEDIELETDTIRAAKTTLHVKFSYVMITLTIVGCIIMVTRGKQAVKRHETLTSINLEKKAQWREEATQSTSAKP
ncbi:LOW QUALITY PROTEIN: protein FAM162A-like [Amazona ochrocephala]